ncbi:hypothetical protein G7085_03130 [Tessaracoccus sp. HDW20]|uniref:hypothetical protein n=1 Tax=Tessaracoccus coleopterorum TaxID=2714950 RepID=UPI0018D403BF|nr:hypothetical protein [Tessaracoccus coleopterorum]NHB83996.1 hypothetical protein [Tessaracoccus coleopterorum]
MDLGPLLIVLVVAVAIGLGLWAWLHHRYVKSFESRGWTYLGSPSIAIAHGLNVPPFGEGFERSVKKQVTGAAPTARRFPPSTTTRPATAGRVSS